MKTPQAAELYLRLSDLRREDLNVDGVSESLTAGERRLRKRAKALGWKVARVVVENDIVDGKPKPASAFKRRKVTLPDGSRGWRVIRPKFRETLDRLMSGKSDGLLALDLDRIARDNRDLEDLIDLVEHEHVPVESESGSVRLTTDADITMARVMVAMGNKSSRDTARRVAWARERQARAGLYGGGKRRFGFCAGPPAVPDGASPEEYPCRWHGGRDCRIGVTVIGSEADVIADCSKRVLNGVTLKALTDELRERGVPTVTGVPWAAEVLRDILLRPCNAALVAYRGEILEDVKAAWEPIVDPEVFYAVRDLLTDPSRRLGPGPTPKWLGSCIYRCGVCTPPGTATDRPMICKVTSAGRAPRYVCKEYRHLTRNAAHADDWVNLHIAYYLTHPRAYELLTPPSPEVDADALRTEKAAIRTRLEQIAEDEVLGLKTRAQVIAATRKAKARIEEIDQELTASLGEDPLAEIINAPDPAAAYMSMPLADRRVIIDRLCTVTILPTGRRGRGFDRSSVVVEPKHHLGRPEV
jgi:site-specific DNA recombinase